MHAPPNTNRIGQPVPRKEDLRFVAGKGQYADDFNVDGQAFAIMVRSPHAHAVIRSIDRRAALAIPGVVAVLTGADYMEALGYQALGRAVRGGFRVAF